MFYKALTRCKMDFLSRELLILSFLYAVSSSSQSELCCGRIFPESPVLELGREFTATCVLSELGRDFTKATADDIYWEFKDVLVPKEYYRKINDTAASIKVNVTTQLESPLKCNVLKHHKRNVHGIFFTVGYPPEKPENLSCVVPQSGNELSNIMTCTWDPGKRDPILETNYVLLANESKGTLLSSPRSPKRNNTAHIEFSTMPIFENLNIWVEVENKLGKATSNVLVVDPADMLKTNPPLNIEVVSEEGLSKSLLVRWNLPIIEEITKLNFNIRFCANGSSIWSEIAKSDTRGSIKSFRLQNLQPYTEYIVQVRCMSHRERGYWSEWSINATAKTPEDKPSTKPDLWRVIIPSEDGSRRRVKLMWKAPIQSNGRILGYTIEMEKDTAAPEKFDLMSDRKEIEINANTQLKTRLMAYNSQGVSPPASLIVPRVNRGLSLVERVNWSSQDGKLWVEWLPLNRSYRGFVLEWISVSDGEGDWQREPGSARNATLKGNLLPFKRYNVSVYPVSGHRNYEIPETPYTTPVYLKQGTPLMVPSPKLKTQGKHEVELEWTEIPIDSQRGFLIGYTLFYSSLNGEKSVSLPPETRSFKLDSLSSNSDYVVWIMASTSAGSANGTNLNFKTLKYASGEIEAIVVCACIAFLFLNVLLVLVCINKKKMIKKHIWPQVPDPSNSTIANWSPGFLSRSDSPKEGSMTDVSVVEVDVFDKKSIGEEDETSLPLRKDKYLSEEHSSGISGSSCMSSPRQSMSDSDSGDSGQTTASTVHYTSVVASGYKGQTPAALPAAFVRSESTQPLLGCEEPQDEPQAQGFSGTWEVGEGCPINLLQIEIAEQNSGSLGFCPTEEGPQQTMPTEEKLLSDRTVGSTPNYLAQASGYRPQ